MIEFLIHMETPSQNTRERQHWRLQRREVEMWCAMFSCASCPANLAKKKRRVVIHAYRRRMCSDDANFIGGCKSLIDGLVRAGLLVDDSREWMVAEYHEHRAAESPTGKACTRVQIEDL